jgi:hypothetical protein
MHHAPKSGMHHPSPEPSDVSVGGLTRVQPGGVTLLDAWPDANKTSHGLSLPLGEVLAARWSVPQPFL